MCVVVGVEEAVDDGVRAGRAHAHKVAHRIHQHQQLRVLNIWIDGWVDG